MSTYGLAWLDSLQATVKALQRGSAEVGVFATADSRDDGESNATIGYKHEFGGVSSTGNAVPRRSFLRMPLLDHGKAVIASSGIEGVVGSAIKGEAKPKAIFDYLGAAGKAVVDEAFRTGGFGQWDSLADMTTEAKGNDHILIETGQLQASIGYRVK